MIAALPMYARADNRAAHDALWAGIRDILHAQGIPAPETLDHETAHDAVWDRDDLLLGHICNLPYIAHYQNRLTYIGTSDYGLHDTPAGYYRSLYIVRHDDRAKTPEDCADYRFAYNDPMSRSGWGAPHAHMTRLGLALKPTLETGAHRASLRAVAQGDADLAAIDAQSWWMDRHTQDASSCRIIGQTDASPGQTFVTAYPQHANALRTAIPAALADLPPAHLMTLGLRGIVDIDKRIYAALPIPPKPALQSA